MNKEKSHTSRQFIFCKVLKPLIVLVLFFCYENFYSQQTRIDSLKRVFKTSKHDTTRCKILYQLIQAERKIDVKLNYHEQLKQLAEKNIQENNSEKNISKFYNRFIANSYISLGEVYYGKNEFQKTKEFYLKSVQIYERTGDTLKQIDMFYRIGYLHVELNNLPEAINYFSKHFGFSMMTHNNHSAEQALFILAKIHKDIGDIPKSLNYYITLRNLSEKNDDNHYLIKSLLGIGGIYYNQKDTSKALEYINRALYLSERSEEKKLIISALSNVSTIYIDRRNYNLAISYLHRCLKLSQEINDKYFIASSFNDIGRVYFHQDSLFIALDYFEKSLVLFNEYGQKNRISNTLCNIGKVYFKQNNILKALEYGLKAFKVGSEIDDKANIKMTCELLYKIYKKQNNSKKALEMYEKFIHLRDNLYNEETQKQLFKSQFKYEYEKKVLADSIRSTEAKKVTDAQLAESNAKLKQEKTQKLALYGGLVLVLIFAFFIFNRFRVTQKQKNIIEQQKIIVDESQRKMLDSINYAKKIQHSILPSSQEIGKFFPDLFIFYKPKDIVSGDFYWFHHQNDLSFFAVADCTGHGIPGAFMTMIAHSILIEVVVEQQLTSPDKILYSLHHLIFRTLQQKKGDEYSQDGLDISFCVIDHKKNLLHFSGARNNAYLTDGENIKVLKATPKSIGGLSLLGEIEPYREFKIETVELKKDTMLVLTTDGMLDQLSESDEKFGVTRFKEIILKMYSNDSEKNGQLLETTFSDWKKSTPQLDDILLASIRF